MLCNLVHCIGTMHRVSVKYRPIHNFTVLYPLYLLSDSYIMLHQKKGNCIRVLF